jgi:hypothetical protein
MTDPTPILADLPPGSQLYLHSRTPDDGMPGRPTEVAVFKVPGIAGGCVCYALLGKRWRKDHGERHALALMMGRPPASPDPTVVVRVPESLVAAAQAATGLQGGVAVRDALAVALTLGEQVRTLQDHITQMDARVTALEAKL